MSFGHHSLKCIIAELISRHKLIRTHLQHVLAENSVIFMDISTTYKPMWENITCLYLGIEYRGWKECIKIILNPGVQTMVHSRYNHKAKWKPSDSIGMHTHFIPQQAFKFDKINMA